MLIRTSKEIPKTEVNTEFGQINSAYNELKFGLTQNFSLPQVYQSQKNYFLKNITLLY